MNPTMIAEAKAHKRVMMARKAQWETLLKAATGELREKALSELRDVEAEIVKADAVISGKGYTTGVAGTFDAASAAQTFIYDPAQAASGGCILM